MKKLFAACVAALVIAAGTLVCIAGPVRAVDEPCPTQPSAIPAKLTNRPVVFVHGWTGSGPSSASTVKDLHDELGSGYDVRAFDYGWSSTSWGASKEIRTCLAEYLTSAGKAFKASGGDGKVITVAHSMGGVAVRAASAEMAANSNSGYLGGLVTIGTPHQGTPWAGNFASLYEGFKRVTGSNLPLPSPDSSAAKCLAWPLPATCDPMPYLPAGVKIAMVAGQITVQRKLFDLQPFQAAEFPIGDAIVPEISATGYVNSASGPYPGGFVGEETIKCEESSSYITRGLLTDPRIVLGKAAILELLDTRALDKFIEGKPDGSQVPWVLASMNSECFHGNLPTSPHAIKSVANYVRQMGTPANSPTGEPARPPSSAPDSSGPPSEYVSYGPGWYRVNAPNASYNSVFGFFYNDPNGPLFWIRIDGYDPSDPKDPDWITFVSHGRCTRFATDVTAEPTTKDIGPPAHAVVRADNRVLADLTKNVGDKPTPLDLDITGVDKIDLGGSGNYDTYAVFGSPRLYCNSDPFR